MVLSVASILTSLGFVLILTLLLFYLLWSKKSLKKIRADFIFTLFLMIFLRLMIPIEFPTAITIKSTWLFPTIYKWLLYEITIGSLTVSILTIFCSIWAIGVVIQLGRLLREHVKLTKNVNRLETDSISFQEINQTIKENIDHQKIKVSISNVVSSAVTVGAIHPQIILADIPDLTKQEKNFILAHELQHIKNKDILLKYLLEVLVAIYWWFPPMYLLRKGLSLVIEMRVDSQVTKNLGEDDYFAYVESLVSVNKKSLTKLQNSAIKKRNVVHFSSESSAILRKRVSFLMDGFEVRKTNRAILLLLVILPIFFVSTVFEPYSEDIANIEGTVKLEDFSDGYILRTSDNKYYLILNGKNLGEATDLNQPFVKDLPIINETR
ncbi:M56 family metallopeptidase [Enterococcus sp. HY326]|uniref:M56 family metallopeptidase n=1 Tax=Enterococcus sp. HY326 TaxID=2971265 RepID=UPI00224039B6|nr:M56 family metallopeptidase [Enterococcus sp. HY326]